MTLSDLKKSKGGLMKNLLQAKVQATAILHKKLELDEEPVVEEPAWLPDGDGRAFGQQNLAINMSPLHAEDGEFRGESCGICDGEFRSEELNMHGWCEGCEPRDFESYRADVYSYTQQEEEFGAESTGLSKNAKMALGLAAVGVGIAAWNANGLMSWFDKLKKLGE